MTSSSKASHQTYVVWAFVAFLSATGLAELRAQERQIPEALKAWGGWVTWEVEHLNCPTVFYSANEHICFWPSALTLAVDQQGGEWTLAVTTFSRTWVPLPGGSDAWPIEVQTNEESLVVVERNGKPSVRLTPRRHQLSGKFSWDQLPQQISIPPEIGILSLSIEGEAVPIPTWDATGQLWLKRVRSEPAEQDLLAVQVYRIVEDGIPTWLTSEIEVTVSGESREEDLGWILPDGFRLSTVDSPLPVAVDDAGRMRAQVRAGKWTVSTRAFRMTKTSEIRFADGAEPLTNLELVGYQSKPEFRLAEIEGLPTIDVSQTTFPDKWRRLPVYQWDTSSTFQLTEKMRGTGLQRPEGLTIERQFWLDEDGQQLTYRDRITGAMQQIWRLDVAPGQELGAVRVDGKGQLITANPQNDSQGVEIRTRNLDVEAIGRVNQTARIPATGWQTDVDSLNITLILPPGWRVFALFGADKVQGDWLTAWWLLDLFLLLIFALAVFRIWGLKAGLVAFLAFGLAYHEPASPRLTWFFLLIPIALLKVVPEGSAKKWINLWKYLALALLVINLVPFLARQVQTAIYPQLETPGVNYAPRGMLWSVAAVYKSASRVADYAYESAEAAREAAQSEATAKSRFQASNLLYDPQASIQTGPAQPQWSWNVVQCIWDGPVTAGQTLRPILIPLPVHRLLNVARVLLLAALGAILLDVRKPRMPSAKTVVATGVFILVTFQPEHARAAEIPDQAMLSTLRERLLQPPDVYPRAAEIPVATLEVSGNVVTMEDDIHTATSVAVPLPGRLPVWSPLSVSIAGQPADLVCRKDGYLWIVLPEGVHRVRVESMLPEADDWEWTFLLKPRRIVVTAPAWNVTGIGLNGTPEQQVFFSRQQRTTAGEASYDRKDLAAIVVVDRHLEIGLVWQVRSEVTRLSATGKAVSLKVPLPVGESVLTSNVVVEDGQIAVRLGAEQEKFSWLSELPVGSEIQLVAREDDLWVERWHLVTSPVWNVARSGLTPVFESHEENMIPVWHPWPGEEAGLSFSKPQPISGEITTVQQVEHALTLGRRQRTAELKLQVECSIGSDFVLQLSPDAEVTSLNRNEQTIPVRRDGENLIVPVHPGRQTLQVTWRTNQSMETLVDTGPVTLPVDGSNSTTVIVVPDSRWVLWADGPLRGPAVRFWAILVSAILIALVLGSLSASPLSRLEWILLAIGLTQIHVAAALLVVVWLFVLAYRGQQDPTQQRAWLFDLSQLAIILITLTALGIFVVIVRAGLLGDPEMFIIGHQSTRNVLRWFQPRTGQDLPVARIVSVSVWFYHVLMLFWALWLATALLRWLQWGWTQFSTGGCWRRIWKSKQVLNAADPLSN